jgi:hypothetical protein
MNDLLRGCGVPFRTCFKYCVYQCYRYETGRIGMIFTDRDRHPGSADPDLDPDQNPDLYPFKSTVKKKYIFPINIQYRYS